MRLRAVAANLKAWGDCLIVDDNAAFLEAATTLLERDGMNVVGTASTIADALREVQDVRPDVVLVDISLGTEAFDLARLWPKSTAARPSS